MNQEIETLDLGGVNAYLICENESYLLVDTGGPMMLDKGYDDRRELLEQKLQELRITKDNLKLIVLTHGDSDHCANAASLSKQYLAPIAMHPADLPMVEHLTPELYRKSCKFRSFPMKITAKLIHGLIKKVAESVSKKFETFTPAIQLSNQQSLEEYGFHVKILALPGHTPGSIGIYTENHSLICGDLYTCTKKPAPAMNAWDFKQVKQSIDSLHNLPIVRYYPGHGNSFVL